MKNEGMKKYDNYKDSGIQWIGEIPEHWESTKLKFFGESIIGIIYSPDDVVTSDEGILVLRSSNIQDGKLAFEDCVFVNKEVQEKYLTKEGDILLCARNGSAHLVGKAAYIDKQNEGVTFGAFMSIVRSELEKYLFYFFNSQVFKAQTGLFSTSTINQLTSSTLNNMFISFPRDKQEQSAIAAYLDRKTAEIDQLIAGKKCLLELYEEEKTALINNLVTGKTVWSGASTSSAPGDWAAPVEVKDSGIEWLGEIPEDWEVKRFNLLFQFSRGLTITKANLKDKGIPCVNYGEIHSKYGFELIPEEHQLKYVDEQYLETSKKSLLKRGYFVFADTSEDIEGSGNFTYLNSDTPTFAGYHTIIAVPKTPMVERYIAFFMDSLNYRNQIRSQVYGIKVYSITQSILKNTYLLFPPIEEQKEIVEYLDNYIARINAKKEKAEKLINLLTEYREALISEVVTGKVKVV